MTIQEELLQRNPFASTAAANPWENSMSDISSLNDDVSEQIFSLIKYKATEPQTPLSGLILGGAGSGKTHMLKRILDKIWQNDINAIFVNVRAFSAHERIMRNLWREIFVNLLKKHNDKTIQFDFIVSRVMNICRKYNAIHGIPQPDEADGIRYFQKKLPDIHQDFLKVFFAYFDHTCEERRQIALSWLKGDSDDEHSARLGVENRIGMSPEALEDEAQKMILSLGLLLELCEIPMVVCFDQIDAMEEPVLINAWGKAVAFLINDACSMLPLAFVKELVWRKRFLEVLSDYVEQRFHGNRFTMKNCTLSQARQLIFSRITSFFGENSEDKYEWVLKQLDDKLKDGYSPRRVLNLANQVLRNLGEPKVTEKTSEVFLTLDKEYREECDKVAANFPMWQPDAVRLRDALEFYLTNHPYFKAIERLKNLPYISLTGRNFDEKAIERDCAFIINTGANNQTVLAALKHGVAFIESHPQGICYYITDERCNFRGPQHWVKLHETLGKFKTLGGKVLFLDQEQAINWYGLTALSVKVRSGDVTLFFANGEESVVGMDELKQYMEQNFKINLLEIKKTAISDNSEEPVKEKKNRDVPSLNEDELVKNVSDILKNSPMRFMKIEMLLCHLDGKVTIKRERLLEFLGSHTDKFSLFLSGDGTIVMLKVQ